MLETIFITVLLIVALDRHITAKHYKECYEQMRRFYNDANDSNWRLRADTCRLRMDNYRLRMDNCRLRMASASVNNNKNKD